MVSLSPGQGAAVKAFADWSRNVSFTDRDAPFFLLNGFAGTGKSFLLPHLVEAAGVDLSEIVFMAPTGKASKVMTQKMRDMGIDAQATTIHKAIYRPRMHTADRLEAEVAAFKAKLLTLTEPSEIADVKDRIRLIERDLEKAYKDDSPQFSFNVESAVRYKSLIVVDEASMIDQDMADDLRYFGIPILAIGDPGQLPPINGTPGFMTRDADASLTEIHRQAADNPIIALSAMIREGKRIKPGRMGSEVEIVEKRDDTATYDLERDVQIIVGRNEHRWRITRRLREMQGFAGQGPVEGEMMIVNKNSRKHPMLVNGTPVLMTKSVGELEQGDVTFRAEFVDEDGNEYQVPCIQQIIEQNYLGKDGATAPARAISKAKREDNNVEIDWSYAITCHKSQGSQWDEVVVHDESGFFSEPEKWLYVGCTRAAKKLTLVLP